VGCSLNIRPPVHREKGAYLTFVKFAVLVFLVPFYWPLIGLQQVPPAWKQMRVPLAWKLLSIAVCLLWVPLSLFGADPQTVFHTAI
jgi:hypothetical protein